jgi:UDP-GlcNAc:undecaprenyl-phosphate GlcNAc-1-phosphate transferase
MMNSINMIDNMDAISSIVSVVILFAMLLLLLIDRNFMHPMTVITIGLVAAVLGFLFFNWNPSKMYMGDTGSQFLGFILAYTGIVFIWNYQDAGVVQPAAKRFFMVATLFVLPLSDTITVTIKRLSKKHSPFVGGKDHTTHHLSYMGLSDRMVAIVYLIIALIAALLLVFMALCVEWPWYMNLLPAVFFLGVFLTLFIISLKNQDREKAKKDETNS